MEVWKYDGLEMELELEVQGRAGVRSRSRSRSRSRCGTDLSAIYIRVEYMGSNRIYALLGTEPLQPLII